MRFLRPEYLWFALATLPIVLLHLRWRRRRRVRVAALTVWREVAKTGAGRAGLRRLRDTLPMLLSCLAVLALAVAAAEPVTGHEAPPAASRVVVLDTSLSMAMRDDGSRSRLDLAREVAAGALAGLGPEDDVTVWTAGERPRVLVGPTRSADEVRSALTTVTTGLGSRTVGETVVAARLALRLREREASVLVISDRPEDVPVELRPFTIPCRVGPDSDAAPPNARLLAVRASPNALVADVSVSGAREAPLFVVASSRGTEFARVEVPSGDRASVELALPPDAVGEIDVRLDPPDGFAVDDRQALFIARPRPLVVAVRSPRASPSVYLTAALSSLPDELLDRGRALVTDLDASEDVLRAADVVITESGPSDPAPRPVPGGIATLTFGAAGAEASDPRLVTVGEHPVVAGVVPGPVRAPSARLLSVRDGEHVLLACEEGAVAVAGRDRGARHVRIGLLPSDGTFALEGAFPILVRNALRWLRDDRRLPAAVAPEAPIPLSDATPEGMTVVELRGPGGTRSVPVGPGLPLPVVPRDAGGGLVTVHVPGDPAPFAATAIQWTPREDFTLATGSGGLSANDALATLPDRSAATSTLRRHDRPFAALGALLVLLGALAVGRGRRRRAPFEPVHAALGLAPAGLRAPRPTARVQ